MHNSHIKKKYRKLDFGKDRFKIGIELLQKLSKHSHEDFRKKIFKTFKLDSSLLPSHYYVTKIRPPIVLSILSISTEYLPL